MKVFRYTSLLSALCLVLTMTTALVHAIPAGKALARTSNVADTPPPYAGIAEGVFVIRTHLALHKRMSSLRQAAFDLDPVLAGALDPDWLPVIERLERDNLDGYSVRHAFARLGPDSYTPAFMATKVAELYGVPGIGIGRTQRTTPAPPTGYSPPVQDTTAGSVLDFIESHAAIFDAIYEKHGVDKESIVAILLMETAMGLTLGNDPALRSLGAMAATNDTQRLASKGNQTQVSRIGSKKLGATLKSRSDWAYEELKALFRYADSITTQVWTIPGSYYGAIGLCQFMPSSIERFGADGDGDGVIDPFSVPDALYSVASYLEANGWRNAKSEKGKHAVVMTYNQDALYASSVLGTAKRVALAQKGKVPRAASIVAGGMRVPSARLDPSLRRLKPPPARARVKSLGSYQDLLQ